MSRISLAELQGMSREQLRIHWVNAEWPFDRARCSACLTQHVFTLRCGLKEHETLRINLPRSNEIDLIDYLIANREALYAARIFFDPFYAPMVEEPAMQEVEK